MLDIKSKDKIETITVDFKRTNLTRLREKLYRLLTTGFAREPLYRTPQSFRMHLKKKN